MPDSQYEFLCRNCPVYGTDQCDRQALWCCVSWLVGPNEAQRKAKRLMQRLAPSIPELNAPPKKYKVKKRSKRARYDREYYIANRERKLAAARLRHKTLRGITEDDTPPSLSPMTTEERLQERLREYRNA